MAWCKLSSPSCTVFQDMMAIWRVLNQAKFANASRAVSEDELGQSIVDQ